jgi:hypothetical protein
MILVFNNDDFHLIDTAYADGSTNRSDQSVLGIPYCYLRGHDFKGLLAPGEALYISAHGNAFEIGNEGNEIKKYNIPADALAQLLIDHVLPDKYQGNIYLSCCDSHPTYDASFKQQLRNRAKSYGGTVYGVSGKVGLVVQAHGWGGYRIAS